MAASLPKISDYPNGWRNNLSVRNIPIVMNNTGHTFWVDSSLGADGGSGDRDHPFATLDYAIGRCTANNNDRILVAANHAETITSAGGVTCDVAGVAIVGIGEGTDRPTFTFGSSTGASVVISAANVSVQNILGLAGIDALTNPFHIQASDCALDIEWQDGSATVEAARVVLTTAAADNLFIKLKYNGFIVGNANVNAVRLVGSDNVRILIDYYGVNTTAVVEFLTTACTNVMVSGYAYVSGVTDGSQLVVDTATGSTWYASIEDGAAGAKFSGGSGAALAADDVSSVSSLVGTANATTTDSLHGKFGTDTELADRSIYDILNGGGPAAAATAAAPANDVSLYAVLRQVYNYLSAASGVYVPGYGFSVTKSHNLSTDNVDLFTVTGKCLVCLLTGEVTTIVGTTTTYAMRIKTTNEAIFAATTITTDAAGTMYLYGGDPTVILNNTGSTPVTRVGFLDGAGPVSPIVVGLAGGSDTIESDLDGAGTGVIAWTLYYLPLEAGASIVAA